MHADARAIENANWNNALHFLHTSGLKYLRQTRNPLYKFMSS